MVSETALRWRISPFARVLATVAVAPILGAVLTGRGGLVGLAVPALLWLAVAGSAPRAATARLTIELSRSRCVEGDEVELTVSATVPGADVRVECRPDPNLTVGRRHTAGPDRWSWTLTMLRWGRVQPRPEFEVVSAGGVWRAELHPGGPGIVVEPARLDVFGPLRGSLTRPSYGEQTVRSPGPGVEFLDVRLAAPGQPVRRVHWPATLRTGHVHVAGFAATRNQGVLIVVDASEHTGVVTDRAFDRSVRAAVAIARTQLSAGDRVGVVLANPDLSWQRLGSGPRHLVRIVDTLVDARRQAGFVRPTLDRLPNHLLTPGALVICLSPLLGRHSTAMVAGVFRRGHPTVVIDVLADEPEPSGSAAHRRAVRIWQLEREAIRFELAGRGVLVVPWPSGTPLAAVLAPVAAARALTARPVRWR